MHCPIRPKALCPQTSREAAFAVLKGGDSRTTRPTKARASWIYQETCKLVDRRAALQRAHQAIAKEVKKSRRSFQRALRGDRQGQDRETGKCIEALMELDRKQKAWKRLAHWYRHVLGGQASLSREHLDSIVTKWAEIYR